jgi:hypothetical protein
MVRPIPVGPVAQTGAEHGLGKIRRLCGRETIRAESAQREQTWKRTTRKRARRAAIGASCYSPRSSLLPEPNLSLVSSIVSIYRNDKVGFLTILPRRSVVARRKRANYRRRNRFGRGARPAIHAPNSSRDTPLVVRRHDTNGPKEWIVTFFTMPRPLEASHFSSFSTLSSSRSMANGLRM